MGKNNEKSNIVMKLAQNIIKGEEYQSVNQLRHWDATVSGSIGSLHLVEIKITGNNHYDCDEYYWNNFLHGRDINGDDSVN